MTGNRTYRAACILCILASGLLAGGCRSTKAPGTDSLAAIHVKGRAPLEIARAVSEAFQSAGYDPVPLPPGRGHRMQFDKRASVGATVIYGDWSSKDIWYRAKIKINSLDEETYLVTCDAFRVLHRGDSHFEEEHRLSAMKRGPYQKVLDEAKSRLEKGPA